MRFAALFTICVLLAGCTSPVQSVIYASAGKAYTSNAAFTQNPKLFVERIVTRADGQNRQYFWYETDSTTHTILYLHGNAEIAERTARSNMMADLGGDTAILEYTGYGPNNGTPTETELLQDAKALIAQLRRDKPQQAVILVGFSIGGSLAALLASQGQADGLVTIAAFTTLKEVAPAIGRPLIGTQNTYDTRSAAKDITVPWVILHCKQDPIIPVRMASELMRVPKADTQLRDLRVKPCYTHFVPIEHWQPAIGLVKSTLSRK